MGETAHHQTRAAIPGVASLQVDPERLEQLWAMRPDDEVAAAKAGRFTLGEMLRWASRWPHDLDLVDGEFWFITALLADTEDRHGRLVWQQASRDTSPAAPAAAGDASSRRSR